MISFKGLFVVGVVSLFIVLSSSYTVKATRQASEGSNEPGCVQGLKDYLEANKTQLNIQSLSIVNGVLNVDVSCAGDLQSINTAIEEYLVKTGDCKLLPPNITICSLDLSLQVVSSGYKGTARDGDKDPPFILEKKPKNLEKVVTEKAGQRGVKISGLRAEFKKDNKGNPILHVSGEFSALRGSASKGRQIVIDLIKQYTNVKNIQAGNFKELPAQR